MSEQTSIEWTDTTWNPVVGCTRVSAGCDHCYAARLAATRLKGRPEYQSLAVITASGRPAFTGQIRLLPERLGEPLRWRSPRRVFVNSMSDLFHEQVPDEFIDQVFAVMALARRHTFQVLTKRPERMRLYTTDAGVRDRVWEAATILLNHREGGRHWPLPNVWLGVSVEDQRRYDERIEALRQTSAAVRFLSCEPLLGPIELGDDFWESGNVVDWVIVGGESGPGSRSFDVAWARAIIQQCRDARVPVFIKQLGARPIVMGANRAGVWPDGVGFERHERDGCAHLFRVLLRDRKGGNPDEWPMELRRREYPETVRSMREASDG